MLQPTLQYQMRRLLGDRVVHDIPLEAIYPYVNTTALFRGQWGFRRGQRSRGDFHRMLHEEAEPVFERLKVELRENEVLKPALVYGWFPCGADGEDLVVFDPTDSDVEIERFCIPTATQASPSVYQRLFLSGRQGHSGMYLGCRASPWERGVSELAAELFERNEYTEYLYVHGMGVECAEALAELWHKRMRQELRHRWG